MESNFMQPDDFGSPKRWLAYAKADLVVAKSPLPQGALYEQWCYHAQQVAEKAIKAVLIFFSVDFPYTHNIRKLLEIASTYTTIPEELYDAGDLTQYASNTRYPNISDIVEEQDYIDALSLAEKVYDWAENLIETLGTRND